MKINTPQAVILESVVSRKGRVAVLLISFGLSCILNADTTWRSELYPEDWDPAVAHQDVDFRTDHFIQDFSYAGYHRGERIIPHITGPVFNVLDNGADPEGEADSTEAIQETINEAASAGGGVVYLPEGEYLISRRAGRTYALNIYASGIVFRGAGTERTFLKHETTDMRNAEVIRVVPSTGGNWGNARSAPKLVASDYTGPTRSIRLDSVSGLQVGHWVVVHNPFTDQKNDGDSFVEDVNMDLSPPNPSWLGLGSSLGGTMDYREIVAVDAEENTIEIDAPTRWFLLQRDGARIYYVDAPIEEVGLEGFSIGNIRHPFTGSFADGGYNTSGTAPYDVHGSWLIKLERVRNSWVRDVSSYDPENSNGIHMLSNGLVLDWSRGVTVQRVSMQRTQYGGGGGNGYMIRLNSVNEILVEDCYVAYCRHGFVKWRMQNSGNVIRNSYDGFTGLQTGNAGNLQSTGGRGSDHHGLLSHSNLFEGHTLNFSFVEAAFRGTSGGDIPHSQTSSQVLYWNSTGQNYMIGRNYIVHSQQMGQGYIIGTKGSASAVRTDLRSAGTAVFTDPVDFSEGIGEGADLEPQSLYMDQLFKRFLKEGLALPPWQGAERVDQGVWNLPGLGNFSLIANLPFMYIADKGWIYFHGNDPENIFIYRFNEDRWYWTNRYILPWMWDYSDDQWVE